MTTVRRSFDPSTGLGMASEEPAAVEDVVSGFHPVIETWFRRRFAAPTDAQTAGWPEIRSGRDVLIAAPTGSGKTLAAFLCGIDALVKEAEHDLGLNPGACGLSAETRIAYVSPLKALGNDIQRNLEAPLEELAAVAQEMDVDWPEITVGLRTGDTPQKDRQAFIKNPPHILITTPESLYLMLTAQRSRETLRKVETVIVDEIHALARDKRGSHLGLSLARLDHVCESRPARIGLSATQRPVEEIAAFLAGTEAADCSIVDLGHQRDIEMSVELPPSDLEAVAAREQWADIYDRVAGLVRAHRTTLVFVNTRRLSERVAHHLRERLGDEAVASHHGSLSKDRRLRVEERLKAGDLQALVCTASLELGIDIGSIDLVCQIGSPRSVATFLQRVGRSGHALGLRPQGRLFPTSRDELIECAALIRAVKSGRLDRIVQPVAPLDIMAQQIVAECACEDWAEDDLYALTRRAWQYRNLSRDDFDEIIEMLSEGVGEGAGRAPPQIHRDRINRVVRGRRGSRMTAILNGGAIPEMADYKVVAEPDDTMVGTVNEDWAIESMAGDIFLLGSHSWRITRVGQGEVRVQDAQGLPPTIPFWLGESPGRTVELSQEVGRLRQDVVDGLDDVDGLSKRMQDECGLDELGAAQIIDYLRSARDALGLVPTDRDVVFERFFDETGGMQLVVHAPFGARINRAWGLTLRKRFCVRFDFELQAAASDDSIVISLGPQHSFPLEESFSYVTSRNAEASLKQAVLYAPVFPVRWRWDAGRALAVPRFTGARKVPPPIQRMRADDLLASVFPAQVGCQENVTGPLEIPDHPLVRQTVYDCLHEAMDIDGLIDVLERIEAGEVRLHAIDTLEPSPMAHEILSGKPYTYLDDAPLEERRTRAVTLRRALPENARELGSLDQDAIDRVRDEAWPLPRDAEEAHDALLSLVAVPIADALEWSGWIDELIAAGRAARFREPALYFAAENLNLVGLLWPEGAIEPELSVPEAALVRVEDRDDARQRLVRGWAEAAGPVSAAGLGERLGLRAEDVDRGLRQVESLGFVLRGRFSPGHETSPPDPLSLRGEGEESPRAEPRGMDEDEAVPGVETPGMDEVSVGDVGDGPRSEPRGMDEDEFCDRRLLARIHRYTLDRLRREIDPVSQQDFMRFLQRWQHLTPDTKLAGKQGVRQAIARLEGFEAPAGAWERELLASRLSDYRASWLDELCLAGDVTWARLTPRKVAAGKTTTASASRATPVSLTLRGDMPALLMAVRHGQTLGDGPKTGAASEIHELLKQRGALFFDEIVNGVRRLRSDVERGLRELVAWGLVTADGFQGLRQLSGKAAHSGRRRSSEASYGGVAFFTGSGPSGRWALVPSLEVAGEDYEELAESTAKVLLQRYGVVMRDLYGRESFSLPWRDVLRALRRLEARGTVRGGRFVTGPAGEQYALPEAVDALRRVRREERKGERVWVNATDPLNLAGVLLPGGRVPAQAGNAVLYVDGLAQPEAESTGIKTPVWTKLPRLGAPGG